MEATSSFSKLVSGRTMTAEAHPVLSANLNELQTRSRQYGPGENLGVPVKLDLPRGIYPQNDAIFMNPVHEQAASVYPLPEQFVFQVSSAAGVGAVNQNISLFNNDIFGLTTNNGSGANSITYTFGDGTNNGAVISNMLAFARKGLGGVLFGYSLRANLIGSGEGNPAALAVTKPTFVTNNGLGAAIPLSMVITQNQTRGDFDQSVEVISTVINLARFSQLQVVVVPGNTYTITFYTIPNFKR